MNVSHSLKSVVVVAVVMVICAVMAYLTNGPDLADVLVSAGLAYLAGYLARSVEVGDV